MTDLATNVLYHGDNLDIREDTWHWGPAAEASQ